MAVVIRQRLPDADQLVVGLALLLLAAVFLPLWKPLLLAAVLATTLSPLQHRLEGRLHGRRRLAAGLLVLATALLVLLPLTYAVSVLVKQGLALEADVRSTLQSRGLPGLVDFAPPRLAPYLNRWLQGQGQRLVPLTDRALQQGVSLASAAAGALSATGQLAFAVAMLLVGLYFLLVDGNSLKGWLVLTSPLGATRTLAILSELRRTASATLTAMVLTAAAQGAVAFLGYALTPLPHPLFWALVTFLLAFVPTVGTALATLPLAAYLVLAGHWGWGLFLALYGLGVVGGVDNLLRPYLARGGAQLHGALVFFSMIGGALALGAMGLLVGPLALTLLRALLRYGPNARDLTGVGPSGATEAHPPPSGGHREDPLTAPGEAD